MKKILFAVQLPRPEESSTIKKPNSFVANLMLTAELAGLWHDYGKIDPEFQAMIRTTERIRSNTHHSLVSYFAFKSQVNDSDYYSCKDFSSFDECDLFGTSAKAILTHHHKPSMNNKGYLFLSTDKFGANIDSTSTLIKSVSENWSAYSEKLISRLKRKNTHISSPNLAFYATRLALMMSDYATSKHEGTDHYDEQYPTDKEFISGKLYAKSAKLVPLERHLFHVAKGAKSAIGSIFMHDYPKVKRLPKIHDVTPLGNFKWQQDAVDIILKQNMKKEDGFFGVIIGETGSGKTQAGYRVMSALRNHNPRFILGLGFGALAVQSGREYQSEIGLRDGEMGVFVGYKHRIKDKKTDEFVDLFDIEPSMNYKTFDHGLSDVVSKLFTAKDLSFITVPVAVMTIDHIMNAIAADRGAYVKSALRIATSDLLIDEIDSFSAQDSHAIARLCYLTGLFGKRVVISSATLPPELSSMLFTAYQSGYNEYSKSFGGNLFVGSFSNKISSSIENVENSFNPFTYFNGYTKEINYLLKTEEQRNKVSVLNLPKVKKDQLEMVFESILQELLSKAMVHNTNIPQLFSSCFVRFNFTKDAQAFFLYLIKNAKDIKEKTGWNIKTNFYSGQMDENSRKEIESKLSIIMNRKSDSWITDVVKKIEDKTLFILVTTPVIEVGRDFDFDFCVLEPSGYMSIIQSSGRVLRHRRSYYPAEPNVILMSDSIRGLTNNLSESKCRFGANGPGFQQVTPQNKSINMSNKEIAMYSVKDIFGLKKFDSGIHSGFRLHTNESCIADREDKKMIDLFFKGKSFNKSIVNYINDANSMVTKFYDSVLFRENDKVDFLFKRQGDCFIKFDDDNVKIPFKFMSIENEHCFIELNINYTKIMLPLDATDVVYSPYFGVLRIKS